jgi:RimJ/RimL family protein N-acetyltransferase
MLQFAPLAGPPIGFRPLTLTDLPSMHRWLNMPHVRETYGLGRLPSPSDVAEEYGSMVGGQGGTFPYVIHLGGRDIGYLQTYRIAEHPAYAREIGVDDESAGLDLFLGEPDCVGRGIGPLVIDRFVREVIFATTPAVAVVADPSSSNRRSVRAFEKAGFRRWRTVVPTQPGSGDLLLRRDRDVAPGT